MTSRLHERYDGGRAGADQAVRILQPDAGAAALEDRREHRPRRGADEREGTRRGRRRPDLITGQKPIVTKAKRSIAQFRLRTNGDHGQVTLRGERMWDFRTA